MLNSKHCILINCFWNLCLIGTTNVLAFCLPANVNILPICIIGGALSLIIYQCFPHKDVCLVFVLGSLSRNTVPRVVFPNTLPREQKVYRIVWSLKIMSFYIIPVATEYQEIHLYIAVNIFSVTRRYRSDVGHLLSSSWLALAWLMWPWWVMIPKEDLIYVTLVSEDAFSRLDWCYSGDWGYLKKTLLMWLWWVKMPSRDLTDVTLVSEDTF